jgi:hypothetical protein
VSVRYEYPGGLLPEEVPVIEQFERDLVPYVQKHGSMIGERAMQGDLDAEEIIRRYRLFVEGLPHMRRFNLKLLTNAAKRFEHKRAN